MTPTDTLSPRPGLKRSISRWQSVGLALNDVIGSGIYLLPAVAAFHLGSASAWAVLVAGGAVLLLVLCFAEAATHFEGTGGAYLYTREAFGELVGFEVGWMTWLARVASVAALSAGFAQAVSYLWPAATEGAGRAAAIAGPLLALTAINLIGVKAGARTAVFLVVSKIVPLLIFVFAGVFAISWPTVVGQTAAEGGSLAGAAFLLLFAYAGFENTAAPGGEYKNPQRDIPFALLVHIGIVTTLYLAVQMVVMGTLPDLAGSETPLETPLADASQIFLGGWGGLLLTVGAALSILGTQSNTVLAGPRYLFALAENGLRPRALAYVHPRFRTPAVAILLQTAIALPLALSGSFVGLAALSVVARLFTYLGTALAVPILRRKLGGDGFRLPGGPTIPIAAALVTLGLATSAGRDNLLAAAAALGVGLVLYLSRRRID